MKILLKWFFFFSAARRVFFEVLVQICNNKIKWLCLFGFLKIGFSWQFPLFSLNFFFLSFFSPFPLVLSLSNLSTPLSNSRDFFFFFVSNLSFYAFRLKKWRGRKIKKKKWRRKRERERESYEKNKKKIEA